MRTKECVTQFLSAYGVEAMERMAVMTPLVNLAGPLARYLKKTVGAPTDCDDVLLDRLPDDTNQCETESSIGSILGLGLRTPSAKSPREIIDVFESVLNKPASDFMSEV